VLQLLVLRVAIVVTVVRDGVVVVVNDYQFDASLGITRLNPVNQNSAVVLAIALELHARVGSVGTAAVCV